jgi:hypothetical protein
MSGDVARDATNLSAAPLRPRYGEGMPPRTARAPRRALRLACAAALLLSPILACGPKSRRDPDTPAREITYDDACELQAYFDERRASQLPSPKAADETVAVDEKGQTIGRGSYLLADPMARRRFARMLRDEYKGVDERIVHAIEDGPGEVRIRVRWWDAGATRRLRQDSEIVVVTAAGEAELPGNPCVADLLFGEKIYDMRGRYLRGEVDRARGDGSPGPASSASAAPPSASAGSVEPPPSAGLATATVGASTAPTTSTAPAPTTPSASTR